VKLSAMCQQSHEMSGLIQKDVQVLALETNQLVDV